MHFMVYRFILIVLILTYVLLVHRSTVGDYNWACTLKQIYIHLLALMILLLCALSNLHVYVIIHIINYLYKIYIHVLYQRNE